MRSRYYAPYLNRWIQPDSIIPDPSNPLDYDRYSYVRNNPVNYTDPSGHWTCGDQYDPACAETANEYIEYMIATDEWVSNPSLNVIVEPFTVEPTYYEPPDGSSYVSQSEPEFNYMAKDPGSKLVKAADGVGVLNDLIVLGRNATYDEKMAPDAYLVVAYSESPNGLIYAVDQVIVASNTNEPYLAAVTINTQTSSKQYIDSFGPNNVKRKFITDDSGNSCMRMYSLFYDQTTIRIVAKTSYGSGAVITIP